MPFSTNTEFEVDGDDISKIETSLGDNEGLFETLFDGTVEGYTESTSLGNPLGPSLGDSLGISLGTTFGNALGLPVGDIDGLVYALFDLKGVDGCIEQLESAESSPNKKRKYGKQSDR